MHEKSRMICSQFQHLELEVEKNADIISFENSHKS